MIGIAINVVSVGLNLHFAKRAKELGERPNATESDKKLSKVAKNIHLGLAATSVVCTAIAIFSKSE